MLGLVVGLDVQERRVGGAQSVVAYGSLPGTRLSEHTRPSVASAEEPSTAPVTGPGRRRDPRSSRDG